MENDLMERYIYAVTRRLDPKQRPDVARELRDLIEDMLSERCAGTKPTERDLRVVLTELGPPGELARKYDPAGDRALIGPPYFGLYKRVLETVLVCMAVGMTLAHGILALLEPGTWYLLERRYSRRVFLTALLANGLSAALMIWWLGAFPVFNPAFFENIAGLFLEDPGFSSFFERFPTFFLAVFLFALALDVLDAFLRSREA